MWTTRKKRGAFVVSQENLITRFHCGFSHSLDYFIQVVNPMQRPHCYRITLKCCSHLLPCVHTPRSRNKLDVIPRLNIPRSDQLGFAVILEIVARSHLSLPFSHHICCSSSELPAHKRYRSRRASSGEKWTIWWCKTIQNDVRQVSYPSHHPCPYGEVIIDNHLVYLFFVLIFQANASLSQDSPPQRTIWHSKGNNPHIMAFNVVIYPGPDHIHGFLYADRKNNHQYFPFCAGKADMGMGFAKGANLGSTKRTFDIHFFIPSPVHSLAI